MSITPARTHLCFAICWLVQFCSICQSQAKYVIRTFRSCSKERTWSQTTDDVVTFDSALKEAFNLSEISMYCALRSKREAIYTLVFWKDLGAVLSTGVGKSLILEVLVCIKVHENYWNVCQSFRVKTHMSILLPFVISRYKRVYHQHPPLSQKRNL